MTIIPEQEISKKNFDNVRFFLALIVFFSHALGLPENAKLNYFYNFFDGDFAVKGFFAISGYLVYRSYTNSVNLIDFFEKRIRRIYPAYVFTILVCILVGILFCDMSWTEFVSSNQTISYILSNLFFLNFLQPSLPGLFEANPIKAVNGSLWTIKVEVMLYLMLPLLVVAFKKSIPIFVYFVILLVEIIWIFYFSKITYWSLGAEMARQFPGHIAYFGFGCLFAVRSNMKRWLPALSIIGILVLANVPLPYVLRLILEPIGYGGLILYLCFLKPSVFDIGKIGDLSYGIYLFHFPIVQLFIHLKLYAIHPVIGVAASLFVTLLMSFISWNLVEKRWLKRNSQYL